MMPNNLSRSSPLLFLGIIGTNYMFLVTSHSIYGNILFYHPSILIQLKLTYQLFCGFILSYFWEI